MKVKPLILGLGLGALLATGCNDDLSLVGPSIQPPEDAITVYNDTFHIQMSTVLMDGVYAKADSAVLGEIYDPLYGDLKSDYICQLYCPEEYQFAHEPICYVRYCLLLGLGGYVDPDACFCLCRHRATGT